MKRKIIEDFSMLFFCFSSSLECLYCHVLFFVSFFLSFRDNSWRQQDKNSATNQDGLIEGEELREFCSLISIAQPPNTTCDPPLNRQIWRNDRWFIGIWEDECTIFAVSYRNISGCFSITGSKYDPQIWLFQFEWRWIVSFVYPQSGMTLSPSPWELVAIWS